MAITQMVQSNQDMVQSINSLVASHGQPSPANEALYDAFLEAMKQGQKEPVEVSTVSTGQSTEYEKPKNVYTKDRIVEKDKEYTRASHPLLFAVVDYLENNNDVRDLGVRKIAEKFTEDTGEKVGKSWAAVAKNYWQSNQEE